MTDADQAAARVEAFLPELIDVPDESRAARLGAKQLADDIRIVFDDRELLRAEVGRLTRAAAIKDEAILSLRRTLDHNVDRAERITKQAGALKVEWSPRASDESFGTKDAALRAAAERYGNGPVDDDEVVWRLVGGWHDGTEDPAGVKL